MCQPAPVEPVPVATFHETFIITMISGTYPCRSL